MLKHLNLKRGFNKFYIPPGFEINMYLEVNNKTIVHRKMCLVVKNLIFARIQTAAASDQFCTMGCVYSSNMSVERIKISFSYLHTNQKDEIFVDITCARLG